MRKLLDGIRHFRANVFSSQRELFDRLSTGQRPDALFITCSDSRVIPNLLTNTAPGEIFVLRNAGNIVPAWGASASGEEATIEFAIAGLGIRDIIVCGHTQCGAMKALLAPGETAQMPSMTRWLTHAEAARRIVRENYAELSEAQQIGAAVAENVLVQVANLETHPVVAARIAAGRLNVHAWIYVIEDGAVFAYERAENRFVPIEQVKPLVPPMPRRVPVDI